MAMDRSGELVVRGMSPADWPAVEAVYAEGIAAESMLVDSRTRSVLPPEMSEALGEVIPGHSDLPHAGLDLAEALLDRPDAAALLRKASTR